MPGFLKQSTASQSRALGPFVDDTDFKTPETGLTIANTDIKLVVNGAASANKNSGGGTHRVNGVYGVTFDATDTATVGEMEVSVAVSGALIVFDKFFILEEAVYDALFAASAPGYLQPTTAGRTLDVSATGEAGVDWANIGSPTTTVNLSGTSTKALEPTVAARTLDVSAGGEAGVDWANVGSQGTTVGLTSTTIGSVNIVSSISAGAIVASTFGAGAINAAAIATNAIDADALAADAVTEIQAGLATSAALATVQADTDNIQTRIPAALTAGGNIKTDDLYANGRVWMDTGAGAAGTTSYVNGTLTNPNSSMANSRTIANALNLTAFQIRNASSITLDQGYTAFSFFGEKWTLALANRAITNSYFEGAEVSGLSSGTGARFVSCIFGATTVANDSIMARCALTGTFTLGAAGSYTFNDCLSATVAGVDAVLDFGALGATTVGIRGWNGGLEVRNMGASDVLVITGSGNLTIASSCTAGQVYIAGAMRLVNSGSGQTITDSARWSEDQDVANVTGSVGSVTALSAAAVDSVWDDAVDGATTARQSMRLANSANGAKLSGAATTTVSIRDLADTKDRVTATVDASGNRTAVTRDLT